MLILQVRVYPSGAKLEPRLRGLFRVARNDVLLSSEATSASDRAYGFELVHQADPEAQLSADVSLDPETEWLMRCDRVDFPPGGEAFLQTHHGPGIRVLLFGSITIDTNGEQRSYEPGDAWFENGSDPVHAQAAVSGPTAFVRCMILPAAIKGESSIRYVNEGDREKAKSQRYTVYLDDPIELPAAE